MIFFEGMSEQRFVCEIHIVNSRRDSLRTHCSKRSKQEKSPDLSQNFVAKILSYNVRLTFRHCMSDTISKVFNIFQYWQTLKTATQIDHAVKRKKNVSYHLVLLRKISLPSDSHRKLFSKEFSSLPKTLPHTEPQDTLVVATNLHSLTLLPGYSHALQKTLIETTAVEPADGAL